MGQQGGHGRARPEYSDGLGPALDALANNLKKGTFLFFFGKRNQFGKGGKER